ncbi:MAG: SCO family protein [Acidobacteria bacterium]|nr:SCO family protein [Acidobacteriota bacterium]
MTALLVLLVRMGCGRPRQYELRRQIIAVDPARPQITIRHENIRGFMPGMTMPFRVRENALLEDRTPGELVTARLVVEDADAYLTAIQRTGHAPLSDVPPPPRSPDLLRPGDTLPDAPVVDEAGTPRRLSDWGGRALAVTFTYTRCPLPNFCPLMDRHFAVVQRAIAEDVTLQNRVHLLSISIDPAFDTASVLATHTRRAGARASDWNFLTGNQQIVDAFASRFGVSIIREDPRSLGIVHSLRTLVVDAGGRLVKMLSGNEWTPAGLLLRAASAVR